MVLSTLAGFFGHIQGHFHWEFGTFDVVWKLFWSPGAVRWRQALVYLKIQDSPRLWYTSGVEDVRARYHMPRNMIDTLCCEVKHRLVMLLPVSSIKGCCGQWRTEHLTDISNHTFIGLKHSLCGASACTESTWKNACLVPACYSSSTADIPARWHAMHS